MQAKTICITHTHTDHVAALPAHARHHQLSGAAVRYIVPVGSAARLQQLIDGFAALDEGADQHSDADAAAAALSASDHDGVSDASSSDSSADENDDDDDDGGGVGSGGDLRHNDHRHGNGSADGNGDGGHEGALPHAAGTSAKRKKIASAQAAHVTFIEAAPGCLIHLNGPFYVTAFATQHRVRSQGYCVLRKAPGASQLSPEVCFTGDCTWQSLTDVPYVWTSKVLISEMTFVDAERLASARRTMHVHLQDVVPTLPRFRPDARLIFSHFSTRYSAFGAMRHVSADVPAAFCDRISLALQSLDEPRPDVAWALHRAWAIAWQGSAAGGNRRGQPASGHGRGRGHGGHGPHGRLWKRCRLVLWLGLAFVFLVFLLRVHHALGSHL